MRQTRMGSVVLVAVGFLSPAALGQEQAGQSGKGGAAQAQSPAQSQREQAPDGFVLIEERVIVLTANEPQNHFLSAGDLFLAGNSKAAAGEVRMGANYLDMQSSRATEDAKKQLASAAQELRSSAMQLQERRGERAQQSDQNQEQSRPQTGQQLGEQQDQRQQRVQRQQRMQQQMQGQAKDLVDAFAKANYALAQHFQSKAQAAVENNRPVIAGHELAAAADSLIAAVAWTGQQPPQEALQAVSKAQQLAGRLAVADADTQGEAQQAGARQAAGGDIPQDAKQVVQDLGKAVESCGESIRSPSPGSARQASDKSQQNQKQ